MFFTKKSVVIECNLRMSQCEATLPTYTNSNHMAVLCFLAVLGLAQSRPEQASSRALRNKNYRRYLSEISVFFFLKP